MIEQALVLVNEKGRDSALGVFYTYLHCKPNGHPFYVGKGGSNKNRSHDLRVARRNTYHGNIVAKYGKNNIMIYVFPCDSESQALADEIQQIAQLRSEGYVLSNITAGGEGASGVHLSEKTRLKISLARKNQVPPMLGKRHSAKTRAIMNVSKIGTQLSTEARKKISTARTDSLASDDTKNKMSDSQIRYAPNRKRNSRGVFI